jgi:hypothetical protein
VNLDDIIDADAARAAAVMKDLMQEVYEAADAQGHDDMRVDQVMVIAIVKWRDEDGDDRESPAIGSETKNRYAQAGILYSAMREHDQLYVNDGE